jgi:hypothetical protein
VPERSTNHASVVQVTQDTLLVLDQQCVAVVEIPLCLGLRPHLESKNKKYRNKKNIVMMTMLKFFQA